MVPALLPLLAVLVAAKPSAASCPTLVYPPTASTVQDFVGTAFDYVIVGGGTAGVTLAARLAENSKLTIGVLEAGQWHQNDPIVDIPHYVGQGAGNPAYDWSFSTIPQAATAGRVHSIPRGKMLGGSAGLNGMAWGRASAPEYDAWAKFASGWTWANMMSAFKRSENVSSTPTNPYPGISAQASQAAAQSLSSVSGLQGPIKASHDAYYPDPVPVITKTLNGMGFATNAQPQGGNATGIANTLMSIDRELGVRSYAPSAYLCGHATKSNLKFLLGAQATKVASKNITGTFTATGVQFYVPALSKSFTVATKRDVILTAGTIQTPQLLELSGIGNSTILKSVGITPLVDLPGVGENFQEHLYVGVQWQLLDNITTFDILNDATVAAAALAQYNANRTGLLTDLDSTTAYVPLHSVVTPARLQQLLAIFDASAKPTPLTAVAYPLQRAWYANTDSAAVSSVEILPWSRGLFGTEAGKSYVFMLGGLSHPASRGSVHVNSSTALAAPAIDGGFLTQDFDAQVLLDVLKFVQKVGQTAPFKDIIVAQMSPDPTAQTDDDLLAAVRAGAAGGDHLIGTAALGPRAQGGVVDASLKVYGTANVRVVDASVIPLHLAAHIQASVYAVAEKAAADILASLN